MNVLQLIQLLVLILGKALPLPDMKDVQAVERWLQSLNGPLATIIAMLAVQIAERAVEEEAALSADEIKAAVEQAAYEHDLALDPASIIAIVTAIIQIVSWFRHRRRNGSNDPAPTPDVI